MKSSSLLSAGAQWVWVEQTANRSRFRPTLFLRRVATSSVTLAPTAQLSTATRTAGPPSAASIGADCQGAGLEPAGDSRRLGLPAAVAHQADRVVRSDVLDGDADGNFRLIAAGSAATMTAHSDWRRQRGEQLEELSAF